MDQFEGKIAVITGGGSGMGRELARQLAAMGCHVAMCDVSEENMAHTQALCRSEAPAVTRITTFMADVSQESAMNAFRDHVMREHETDCINLLFNNAGIGGGGSMLVDDREVWDKTFEVCWGGVYYGCRAFIPMLVASDEGHLINTSSVNGFWASLGPMSAHTAYSAAKFAVKGFTEALINDFRINAPHVKVSLVMPGHIGTSIVINSGKMLGFDPKEMSSEDLAEARDRISQMGIDLAAVGDEDMRQLIIARGEQFRDEAPMSAAEAANVILDGVRQERWRILVGDDAVALDAMVRETPEDAYEADFMQRFLDKSGWQLGAL